MNMSIKFCSEAYFFQAWGSLTGLKSQTRDPHLKFPPGGLVLRIFTFWKKNPSTSAGFEPANLGSRGKHVIPRPPRSTLNKLNTLANCPVDRFMANGTDEYYLKHMLKFAEVTKFNRILPESSCQYFTYSDIRRYIKKLKTSKPPGPNKISNNSLVFAGPIYSAMKL